MKIPTRELTEDETKLVEKIWRMAEGHLPQGMNQLAAKQLFFNGVLVGLVVALPRTEIKISKEWQDLCNGQVGDVAVEANGLTPEELIHKIQKEEA
jgi:hypothetical protein